MKIAIFLAHGIQNPQWYVEKLKKYDEVIAVDGAANFCKEQGITPFAIIGDFDSVSPDTLEYFTSPSALVKEIEEVQSETQNPSKPPYQGGNPKILHRPSQETTDLQEAIFYAKETFSHAQIDILGGISANEFDHTFSNVLFLEMLPPESKIITEFQTLFLMKKSGKIPAKQGKTISIIALSDIKNLSYINLKYPLKNENVIAGWCGTRNEFLKNECEILFESGIILVILSH